MISDNVNLSWELQPFESFEMRCLKSIPWRSLPDPQTDPINLYKLAQGLILSRTLITYRSNVWGIHASGRHRWKVPDKPARLEEAEITGNDTGGQSDSEAFWPNHLQRVRRPALFGQFHRRRIQHYLEMGPIALHYQFSEAASPELIDR